MRALAEALAAKRPSSSFDETDDDQDDKAFLNACLDEIDRYRRIDEWIPSYHNVLSTTALDCKQILTKAGALTTQPADFLQYTPDETSDHLRVNAFANLMGTGLMKGDAVLRWFLFVLGTDPSPYIRDQMLRILGKTLGSIAIGEHLDAAKAQAAQQDGLVIEQEASTEARAADLARKQTVEGSIGALRTEVSSNPVLKQSIWNAITSPALSLQQMSELLGICEILYTPETSMRVTLRYPQIWQVKRTDKYKFLFSRTFRTTPRPDRSTVRTTSPNIKRENSNPNTATSANKAHPPIKLKFGQGKKAGMVSGASTPTTATPDRASPGTVGGSQAEGQKPKLKIKLSVPKKAGSAGSPPP